MILYPTDDEIIALKEAVLNIQCNEAQTVHDKIACFVEEWNLQWWIRVFAPKPLKINETVLG